MRKIPLHSLILVVGPAGSGKTTLSKTKFEDYEVISSDDMRMSLIGDKYRHEINYLVENEVSRLIDLKLKLGERVVVDSSNLTARERLRYVEIGDTYGVPIYYIIVNRSNEDKEKSSGKNSPSSYIRKNDQFFIDNEEDILRGDGRASVIDSRIEQFSVVKKFNGENVLSQLKARGFHGMTVAGDIHGNLESLKNTIEWAQTRRCLLLQLGDIVDYGPKSVECVDLMYDRVTRGLGIMVIGNHEKKIERWLTYQNLLRDDPNSVAGKKPPSLSEGNMATVRQIEAMTSYDRKKFESRFSALMNLARHHWVIGNFLFTHGAADVDMWKMTGSRLSSKFESLALFGEVDRNSPKKENGYPNRVYNWVDRIPLGKTVVVGHDIRGTFKPKISNGVRGGNAVFMDTGSSKGGHLSTADIVFVSDELKLQNFNWH